jgi:hypothetical protein
MAIEALEVILFIVLFGIDAYAYGNLNEIRRTLASIDSKVKSSYTHIETTKVKEIAAAVKEGDKAQTTHDWHASALEDDLAGVRGEQSMQEQKLRDIEDKLSTMHPGGVVADERIVEMERRLDDRLTSLENTSFDSSRGSGLNGEKIEGKLDEIASSVENIRERVGGLEQEVSALNAASEVQRNEMLQKIEDGTSGFSDRLFDTEERLTGKLKRTQKAEKTLAKRVKKVRANAEAQKSTLSKRVKKVEKRVTRKTDEAEKVAMTAKKTARKTARKVTAELESAVAKNASRNDKLKTVKKTVTTTTSKARAAKKAPTRKPAKKAASGKVTKKTVTKVTRKTPKSSRATKTFEKTVTTEKIVKKAAKKKAAKKRPVRRLAVPSVEKVVKEETTVTTESDSSFSQGLE